MAEINLCDHKHCTGCMSCKQICPHNAIESDVEEGFVYPLINEEKCAKCGLCVKACPVLNVKGLKGECHENKQFCFAAYCKDNDVRMNSSSGGTFSVLAEVILSLGGVVFGAAWDKNMNLMHQSVDKIANLDRLRRSKYVQSDTAETFKEVKSFLNADRKVLYCGTPCQIAGLKSFLGGKNFDNLITVDVLCQGVPSPWAFQKYLKEIEKEKELKIEDCNFRTKKYGWRCGLSLLMISGKKNGKNESMKLTLSDNSFYRAFIREYFMRPSCYNCLFKNTTKGYYSDITIADFWRIGTNIPLKISNYEEGVSAIVLNTKKGELFLNNCVQRLELIERTWEEFSTNGGLRSSNKPSNNNDAFEYLKNHTWRETQSRYFPVLLRERFSVVLNVLLGEKRIRMIKNLLK